MQYASVVAYSFKFRHQTVYRIIRWQNSSIHRDIRNINKRDKLSMYKNRFIKFVFLSYNNFNS